jgi:hypothetical protein
VWVFGIVRHQWFYNDATRDTPALRTALQRVLDDFKAGLPLPADEA